LAHLQKIASPLIGEALIFYLVGSERVIIVVLVVERAKVQIPIYYVRHALAGAEANYPFIEKLTYALVMASRKLRPCSRYIR